MRNRNLEKEISDMKTTPPEDAPTNVSAMNTEVDEHKRREFPYPETEPARKYFQLQFK